MSYSKFTNELNQYLVTCKKNNLPTDNYELILRDKWISDRRYKELIAYILENWNSGNCDDFSRPFSKHLIDNKELALYKRLWKGIIRNRLDKLWADVDYQRKNYPNITLNKIINTNIKNYNQFSSNESLERAIAWRRLYIIDGINEFIAGLETLDDQEEIEKQTLLLSVVANLDKPKPKPTTDKRKIDESLFWQLIDESRNTSTDQFNFLDNLRSTLKGFNPKELRNFDKLLNIIVNELNTQEHWALAYIIRGGCGDDEFDYFKAWAVSKGRKAFNSIKNIEENELVSIFNEDPQLEELYYLAAQVYEDKTSVLMQPFKIKTSKLRGKKLNEDNLEKTFPTLCKLFGYDSEKTG